MRDRESTAAEKRPGLFAALLAEEGGATAIEYALIAGLIFLVVVTAVSTTGADLGGAWDRMGQKVVDNLNHPN